MAVHPDLIEIVCCPRCHGRLLLVAGETGFECQGCQVVYPVDANGIPQLLLDEARPLAKADGTAAPSVAGA